MSWRSALPWGGGVIAAAALIVVAWLSLRPSAIEVMHPTMGSAVEAVYATGTVEPTIMLPVSPRLGARLVALLVDEGDTVVKGQVLARLESNDLHNTIAQLQAQEDYALREYQRDAAMVKNGIIARQTYEKAKANWQAAAAATATAKAQADFMVLTAPVAGRVIKRDGEIGQFIPVNQTIIWLSCLSPLRITAEVDEEDVSLVHPGQKVLIRADAFPGKIFEGQLQSLTPKGDPIARSYRVRITLDRQSPLQIGMTVETNIIVREHKNTMLVPSTAIAGNAVWKVTQDRLAKTAITVGIRGTEKTEIAKGLSLSDMIVVAPDSTLKQNQRVRVTVAP